MSRRLNITTVILLCGLCLPAMAQAQTTVTLDDVLDQIREDSYAAKSAEYQREIAELDYKFYKSHLGPGLSLMADIPNYSKTSVPVTQPDGSISFQSISQANSSLGLSMTQIISSTGGTLFASTELDRYDDFSNDVKQYNGIPIRVGIVQPILGHNPWKYRKEIEPLLLEESKKNYSIDIERSLTKATTLYFEILVGDQNLNIALTNQHVNEKLLHITNERYTLGKISKAEKLQLEIELNQARLSVSQAIFQKKQAIADLYTYLATEFPEEDTEYKNPQSQKLDNIDIPALLSSYRSHRPELIAYQRELLEADEEVSEAKSMYGPRATVSASFGLARGADNIDQIYRDPFTEQQANLRLSIPILDWGKKKSAVHREQIRKQEIEARYEQNNLELENAVRQKAYRMLSLQEELSLLKEIMDKADERFEISNQRYVLGNMDMTNLTIAQREKDQTKRNYINALRSLWVTYYELRTLTGYDIFTNKSIN